MCAAASAERLVELRRASVATTWELVGGATSIEDLVAQVDEWRPDVLVLDASLGPEAVTRARHARPGVRIVSVGPLPGVDEVASSLDELRPAILGLPRPGGPVRSG
jgi:hypothetical protein